MPANPEKKRARDAKFRALWSEGASVEDIRKEFNYASRYGVIRVARELGLIPPSGRGTYTQATERWQLIEDLAKTGLSSRQIAERVGLTHEHVRDKGHKLGIRFPGDEAVARAASHNPDRVMEQTVLSISAATAGLDLVDLSTLNRSKLPTWLAALDGAMSELNRFHRKIKEAARE